MECTQDRIHMSIELNIYSDNLIFLRVKYKAYTVIDNQGDLDFSLVLC